MGAYPTIRLGDDTPTAPAGSQNLPFQGAPSANKPTQVNVSVSVPKMQPSGASHQGGIVPDPGASSGTSKFLREDATWSVPSGGGGGGIPTGSNVMLAAGRNASDSGYSGLSAQKKLSAGELLNLASSWKFSIKFDSGAGVSYVCNAVVYRTLIDDTTIIDVTTVLWTGSATVTFSTTGEQFSDPIALALDTDHDYYIVIYFQSGSGSIDIYNAGVVLPGEFLTGYSSGDKTGLTTGGTVPTSVSPEETLYRVIST